MMIATSEVFKKYDFYPMGALIIGAHWAEEHEYFLKCGVKKFIYVEPCIDAFSRITKDLIIGQAKGGIESFNSDIPFMSNVDESIICFRVACGDKKNKTPMYVSHQNQGQSNSLLEPNLHLQQHPEIIFDDAEVVNVIRLDDLLNESRIKINKHDYEFLYMDVQGAEGLVLKGAIETLKTVKIIYTECNRGETYKGNMQIEEMDEYLKPFGFERVETYWPSPNWTWGDCIYIKR